MSELVTGEAVALELRPARLPSRVLAVALDLVVTVVAYIVVMVVLALSASGLDEAAQIALSIAAFLLVLVGGPIVVETLSHGRSLGKLACGLRVVRDDGGPIRFRHALVRGAIGVVEILMTFGVVACIASLVSARGRRLGDVFAGTLVVRERIPVGRTGFVPPPPPWLAGRFAGLDLSAVPDGLWLAVRQYLTRMPQLDPRVGWGMAERLADDLAACTGAPVPSDVPPAAFLAAVMYERQLREVRRASGAAMGAGAPGSGHAAAVHPQPYPVAPPVTGAAVAPAAWQTAAPVTPAAPPAAAATPPQAAAPASPRVPSADAVREPRPDRPATGFVPPA